MHALSSEFRALTLGESGRTQDTSSAVNNTVPERCCRGAGQGKAVRLGLGKRHPPSLYSGYTARPDCRVQEGLSPIDLERNFVRDDTCEGVSLCRGQ